MWFDSKVDIPLKEPGISSSSVDRFIHKAKKPEDIEYMLKRPYRCEEVTKVAMPMDLIVAAEMLNTLKRRAARVIDAMRWTILTTGQIRINDPGRDEDMIADFKHDWIDLESADDLRNRLEMNPDHPDAARIDEEHTHFVICNVNTANQHFGDRFSPFKTDLPGVVWEINDSGYYYGDQNNKRHWNVPNGVIVVIPMLPPIVAMSDTAPVSRLLLARDDNWYIKHTQDVNFWEPENAVTVNTYNIGMEEA